MHRCKELLLDSAQLLSCRMKDLLDSSRIEQGTFKAVEAEFAPRLAIDQIVAIYRTQMHL